MPDEKWRDELQEYALLVEAVSSGDRSKVVKLFGDYILRKKAQEAEEAEAAAEEEYNGDEYEQGDLDLDGNYGEEYNEDEYDPYYQEDDENGEGDYNHPAQTKRVRFAEEEEEEEEEGGGAEYYDEDGNLTYGDQDYEYTGEEDGLYGQDYNQDEYDDGEDGGAYMSGALPSTNEETSNYYDEEEYGDDYGYDDGTGAYEQEDLLQNDAYETPDQVPYNDYFGSHVEANTYGGNGYYDLTPENGIHDYNMNQQNGGEWKKAFRENEQVTDDQVQEHGINNDTDDLGQPYPEDMMMPDEVELNDLLSRLQQGTIGPDFNDPYVEEDEDEFHANQHHEAEEDQYHEGGEEDDEDDLEGESQRETFGGHASGEDHMAGVSTPHNDEDAGTSRQAPYPDDEESVYDDEDVEDFDFWDDEDPADEANITGYSEDLNQLQQQYWGDEDDDEYEEDPAQQFEEEGFWENPVRPHYDEDVVPFPGFHRTISNERVLPYALMPGDQFDENIQRDPVKEVNPHYNVFDAGQRFYDHYSSSTEDSKVDARKSIQRPNLHPMSLVDKFKERLYAS
ncbi:uncharacterized protein A1O9_10202 [Exophiala aquamarina CBS 119918]|uniref:Uncharacterized protein n=1 Tax=Exophiala aquamarina CBS 119918 TaxID=1182545 RepID=A0A072P1W3_9EURO|nr:uncharacterized protein A1O9_10202 [Exophiala aquamarina CBS 119918]KEF53801.1 hypothetical protein A1O9_10202 [Exophiala aquamarina CBS 119918]